MPIQSVRRLSVVLIILIMILSACNLPSAKTPTPDSAGLIHTIAAQTVEAQMTLDSSGMQGGQSGDSQQPGDQQDPGGLATQTETPFPSQTQEPSPSDTPIPSATMERRPSSSTQKLSSLFCLIWPGSVKPAAEIFIEPLFYGDSGGS